MSKSANPGEMRTSVIIESCTSEVTKDGYPVLTWTNIFGDGNTVRVKWVNVHGTQVFESMGLDLKEPATLTMRYSPLINRKCRVLKTEDIDKPDKSDLYYEIISIDDVEEKHRWLEIKVQRKRDAK